MNPATTTPAERLRQLADTVDQIAGEGLLEHLDHFANPDLGILGDEATLRDAATELRQWANTVGAFPALAAGAVALDPDVVAEVTTR